jgi:GAF domain-containing protein
MEVQPDRASPTAHELRSRIAALQAMAVLDTPPEEAFDALTRLAAGVCDAPIAIVSLIDRDRLWFKSTHGLQATTIPSENSFCSEAADSRKLLDVPDARQDPRFAANGLVTGELRIRSYMGAPILHEGVGIGTVCVLDYVPREQTPRSRQALIDMSALAAALLRARIEAFRTFASARSDP